MTNDERREKYAAMQKRDIQRHSVQTRFTHGVVAIAIIWLSISGLFVFVPALSTAVGADVVKAFRLSHRVLGVVLLVVPLLSALASPRGFKAFLGKYFTKWTPEDGEFMAKFMPYMLAPKKVHMPDQDEVKSGQRVADGFLIVSTIMMIISGMVLWLGTDFFAASNDTLIMMRFIHDLFFILLLIFLIAHIYLGAGIFQPYRGMLRVMWGDGRITESNALYHWGFWARKEIEDGTHVVPENK